MKVTRRNLLWFAALVVVGSIGALPGACGAPGSPATPATAAPAAGTPAVPTVGIAATATSTMEGTGVAEAAPTELLRMLALIPATDELLRRSDGVWFGDPARRVRNYGLDPITSLEAFEALPLDERRRFLGIVSVPMPRDLTFNGHPFRRDGGYLATVGFDYWQVERALSVAGPPAVWQHLEGRFDRAAIEAALLAQGFAREYYRERVIF